MDLEDGLRRAVESQHGGTATLAQSVPVKETHAGAVVWEPTRRAGTPQARHAPTAL